MVCIFMNFQNATPWITFIPAGKISFQLCEFWLREVFRKQPTHTADHSVHASWNVMAHAQNPDFVFRRNGRVHLNRWGLQFSRLLAAEVCASAVVMLNTPCCEVVWRVPATHSIRQFPLHFPSRHRVPSHFNWSLPNITVLTEVMKNNLYKLKKERWDLSGILAIFCHNRDDRSQKTMNCF